MTSHLAGGIGRGSAAPLLPLLPPPPQPPCTQPTTQPNFLASAGPMTAGLTQIASTASPGSSSAVPGHHSSHSFSPFSHNGGGGFRSGQGSLIGSSLGLWPAKLSQLAYPATSLSVWHTYRVAAAAAFAAAGQASARADGRESSVSGENMFEEEVSGSGGSLGTGGLLGASALAHQHSQAAWLQSYQQLIQGK